jgi:hypothetical protein
VAVTKNQTGNIRDLTFGSPIFHGDVPEEFGGEEPFRLASEWQWYFGKL